MRPPIVLLLLFVIGCGSSTSSEPDPIPTTTSLILDADSGDFIGGWGRTVHDLSTHTWTADFDTLGGTEHVYVAARHLTDIDRWWDLHFTVPLGQTFGPGTYRAASVHPAADPSSPAFLVSGHGRTCNGISGQFKVHSVTFGPGHRIDRLHLTFVQHCEMYPAALHGELMLLATPWR